jgi:signal transduction histidine kinase
MIKGAIGDSIVSLGTSLAQVQASTAQPEALKNVEEAIQVLQFLQEQIEAEAEQERQIVLQKEAEVREAYQSKAKFVSVVTHELRIPMTSIKGYTDLLRAGVVGPINEQQASFLTIIRNNVERMSALVSDLSDLNHMDTGRMHLENTFVPVQVGVAEVIQQLRGKIDEKKQLVELFIPEDCPPVYADKNRFLQILTILLSNANHYTPEGGCIIVKASQEGEFARLEVEDNGIGISGQDQEKLFTPFFRSEDPAVREQPGWGLGLAVAKRLVELMRGEMGTFSQLKKGSTFWFRLPSSPH